MILKVIDGYHSSDKEMYSVVEELNWLSSIYDTNLRDYGKEKVRELLSKQSDIFAEMFNSNNVFVPFVRTTDKTVTIFEVDYTRDSATYVGKEVLSEDGETVTHIEVRVLD